MYSAPATEATRRAMQRFEAFEALSKHSFMTLDIKARWRERGFESRDALAREVCRLWRDSKQRPRNVSIKLGELERQKTTWWETRPAAVAALARALDVDVEDVLHPRQVGKTVLPFQEFPAARAFDVTRDQVCELGNAGWFDPRPKGGRWILAPPGTGRSLVAHVHRQRHGMRVVKAPSLVEARLHAAEPGPLLIELERPSDDDRAIEQELLTRGGVVVLAPFPPWAQRNASAERDKGSRPPEGPQWPEVFPWVPVEGWRSLFVRWLSDRVEGGVRFNVPELLEWLMREDPQARLFSTPGDLVFLCAFAHDIGTRAWRRLARQGLVELWLKRRMTTGEAPGSSRDLWLSSQGSQTMRALVRRWFEGSDPWLGALTKERWLELLPPVRIPLERAAVKHRLEELLKTRSRQERAQKMEEVLDTVDSPQAAGDAFHYLASARLFHLEGGGLWRFGSPWVGNLIAQEMVAEALRKRPPEEWGRWTVQPDRQGLIDALLDELASEELVSLAEQCVSRFQAESLGATGAVESLFAALGRRMLKGERFPASVRRLGELQGQLILNRFPGPVPAPLTREGPWESPPEAISWIAICWAWSVSVQGKVPSEELEWLFPGWTAPMLARAPGWLMERREVQIPASIAEQVVERCTDTALPERLPSILLPACIKVAEHRGWQLMHSHVDALMEHTEALLQLLDEMKRQPLEKRQALAGRFWKAPRRNGSGFYEWEPGEELREFVEEHLLVEDFCDNLTDAQLSQYLSDRGLRYVPPRLRSAVLRECIERKLRVDVSLLRSSLLDAECIEPLLGAGIQPEWMVARAFWQRLPERAVEVARQALQRTDKDASAWFSEAPQHAVPRLLELLESHAPVGAEWIEQWLGWYLARGGPLVDRLHRQLLRFRARRVKGAQGGG